MKAEVTGALRALGLCAKARRLIFGVPMICDALKARTKPCLVVSAADNAENSQKRLRDKCTYYGVRLVLLDCTGEELAHAVGKQARLAAVAVTDEQLVRAVEKHLPQETETDENSQGSAALGTK